MMSDEKNKFYVTTPIYYVTARPHLGSLYSTILADVATRWHKLRGCKTFFLTGTDEHGQKVAEAAAQAQRAPQAFVDSFIDTYKDMWNKYEIDYSYFIRTTDESHKRAVQEWIKRLQEKGAIYKSFYTGFYCTPCETYVTEKEGSSSDALVCPSCGRITAPVSEESYFFKLSDYQERLLTFYEEHPDFITPSERMAEVIAFVKGGLKDLSISRTTINWGIPFPGDDAHVTYVWADALNNYITAIGYGNPAKEAEFNFWWPADLQILGKDIVRFHAVYWPAFLMASGLALPKRLLVHGWIKVNNQKMSKSLGNVIDPEELFKAYGPEPIRYYLVRHMAITQDSEFNLADMEQRINSDLANDLGNLLNRMILLAHKREVYEIQPPAIWGAKEIALRDSFWNTIESAQSDMEDGYYYRAYATIWKFISEVNTYFHNQEPWKVTDAARFNEIISATSHSLYGIAYLVWPVLPEKMTELLKSIGHEMVIDRDMIDELNTNSWTKVFMLHKTAPLFAKIEAVSAPTEPAQSAAAVVPEHKDITIDQFVDVMLVVGTISECVEVEKSDKLLKLQVDFGPLGMRQILSGVKKYFTPTDLLTKQAVFVYNLAPRKMMGLESHGMLLTAQGEDGLLSIITPGAQVPNGTRLK